MVSPWFRRKEGKLNPNTADETAVATVETGKVQRQRTQEMWVKRLELLGVRAEITALNREINQLLRKKKEIVSRIRAEVKTQSSTGPK